MNTTDTESLWTPQDVSLYLGVPVETLYRWRYLGIGPPGGRVGKHVRYEADDVRAWFRERKEAA